MAEKDLTFAKAFKTVQPKELANKEEFHEVRIPPRKMRWTKQTVFQSQVSRLGLRCLFSLWPKHHPPESWCKTAQCLRYQEKGLIAKVCTQYRESHSTRYVENVSLTDTTEGTVDLSLYIHRWRLRIQCCSYTFHAGKNCLFTKGVCYGANEFLFVMCIWNAYWMIYIKSNMVRAV